MSYLANQRYYVRYLQLNWLAKQLLWLQMLINAERWHPGGHLSRQLQRDCDVRTRQRLRSSSSTALVISRTSRATISATAVSTAATLFCMEQLAESSPFFIISGAVEKVTVDWVVDAILQLDTIRDAILTCARKPT